MRACKFWAKIHWHNLHDYFVYNILDAVTLITSFWTIKIEMDVEK